MGRYYLLGTQESFISLRFENKFYSQIHSLQVSPTVPKGHFWDTWPLTWSNWKKGQLRKELIVVVVVSFISVGFVYLIWRLVTV